MKYELSHDSLARQVFDKASTEARTRRKVERYVRERYAAYQERGARLTQDDVDFVWPYLEIISSPAAEINHIKEGRQLLQRARRTRQGLLLLTTIVFALLALWAIHERNQAQTREREGKTMRTALAARYALFDGQPALAFRLAEASLQLEPNADARKITMEVLDEIRSNPLLLEFRHQDSITAMAFAPDSVHFLSASQDGELQIHHLKNGLIQVVPHESGVQWAQFLPQGPSFVSLTKTGHLQLWQDSNKQLARLGEALTFSQATLHPDGDQLLAISGNQVFWWKTLTDPKERSPLVHEEAVQQAAFIRSADQWHMITATASGKLYHWNEEGKVEFEYPNLYQEKVTGIEPNNQGDKVIFHTADGDFILQANGDTLHTQTAYYFLAQKPRQTHFFSINGMEKAYSLSNDSNWVYQWNFNDPDLAIDFQWGPKQKVSFTRASKQGERIVMANLGKEVVIRKASEKTTDQQKEIFRFKHQMARGVFSPNQAHFLSTDGGKSGQLWLFSTEFVAIKQQMTWNQLVEFYTTRPFIQPLTPEARAFYQLD